MTANSNDEGNAFWLLPKTLQGDLRSSLIRQSLLAVNYTFSPSTFDFWLSVQSLYDLKLKAALGSTRFRFKV